MILSWNEDYSLLCCGICFILKVFLKKNLMYTSKWQSKVLLICKDQYTDYCMMVICLLGALKIFLSHGKKIQNWECILCQSVLVHPFHSVCSSFKLIFSFTLSWLTEFSLLVCMCESLRLMMGLLTDMLTLSISQVSGYCCNWKLITAE